MNSDVLPRPRHYVNFSWHDSRVRSVLSKTCAGFIHRLAAASCLGAIAVCRQEAGKRERGA